MTERKEVIIQPPVRITDDFTGRIATLCYMHDVEIRDEWLNAEHRITLVLTDKSYDLPEFALQMKYYVSGPDKELNELLLDLSAIDLT